MKYCTYREVHTGNYNCPYASVVNNSIVCNSSEDCYSEDYRKKYLIGDLKDLNNLYGKVVYDLLDELSTTIPVDFNPDLPDEDYPF